MKTLGSRVAYARELTGMSAAEFARAIGVGRAAVSKIESGQTKAIQLDTALKIQKLTKVSSAWLLSGKGQILHSEVRDEQIARMVAKLESLPAEARNKLESDIDYIASLQLRDQ